MRFRRVDSRPSFPKMELEVLKRWKQEKTFEQSLEKTRNGQEFVFYDGPPFPTGNPHHGTLLVSILKDLIPRYKTMRGYYVPRAWGWDCHGLPIETAAEKRLGITDKNEIEGKVGIKAFNDECRKIVSECNDAWGTYIDRIGRWVDFAHPYSTRDRTFMESVIWAFRECHNKGLIYKDFRVSPYCYRCQTALSISDARQDDSTRPRQDRTITVKFRVAGEPDLFFLAWTTTPWTLPSNLALAVGPEIEYSVVAAKDGRYIIASGCIGGVERELGGQVTVLETLKGTNLLNKFPAYQPLFPYFKGKVPNAFKLIDASFVSTGEGTGIVHMAPAFGDDDYWACRAHAIGVVNPVDQKGCFTSEVPDFAGRNVHEANADVIRYLKREGVVVKDETIEHAYPHCWRCRTPLIYKALDAWYLKVEAIKDQLIANNAAINWYPGSIKEGRFGKWLENARDWNISRNRYWATPIPVWECDRCKHRDVFGSVREMEEVAGAPLPDIHKEWVDPIRYQCKCGGQMIHAPEVLDGWFESGSMPYGQFHYPFEHAEHFREHFPADFIVEYTPQLRGWFYVLHVLSTALFNKPAFKNCLVHGTLLAADGKKMSKSQKNYTDPMELLNKCGADAFRAYLLSSNAVLMSDYAFKDEGIEATVRSLLLPIWNALVFFTTYAEVDEIEQSELAWDPHKLKLTELDTFILSETELLIENVTAKLESYSLNDATKLLPEFLDTLNNWYIRRSRQRVWTSDPRDPDKMIFYSVLYRALSRFTQVLAPFCPFISEVIWEALGNQMSVHLSAWPDVDSSLINHPLSDDVAQVRRVITAGLAIRSREKIRVRQPLSRALLALDRPLDISKYGGAIKDELNVKEVKQLSNASEIASKIGKPNAKVLGPKYGASVQSIIKLAREGKFTENPDGTVTVGDSLLNRDEIEISYLGRDGMAVESAAGAVIALDTKLTEELEIEGKARDLVRLIQEMRKEADLLVSDRIHLSIEGAKPIVDAHKDYIKGETLAVGITDSIASALLKKSFKIGDGEVSVALDKAVA